MRQKLGFILTIVLIVGVLILINSLTYFSEEEKLDSELSPNRSTYHSGPTGTRALYDFLSEAGYSVMRWRDTPEKLLSEGQKVGAFVVIGNTRVPFKEAEAEGLLRWVERGGRLVLVDRHPDDVLLPESQKWTVRTEFLNMPSGDVDPGDVQQMVKEVQAVTPAQPTLLTNDVVEVLPSRFASMVTISKASAEQSATNSAEDEDEEVGETTNNREELDSDEKQFSPAPVVHLNYAKGALLVDYPHGDGRIIVLSDPYITSNGGVALRDNLQLAINILTSNGGLIAFDEFHQGRGVARNALFNYFAGTPVIALCAQTGFLILLVFWTRGRRFARPVPLPTVDRRSALEFVASMAEVQQRARAYDLAVENIYSRTRRVLTRYAGLDYTSPRSEIAARVAARSTLDARKIEALMRQCEEVINGGTVTERQSIDLVRRLREVEATLGLRMRSREAKQAAQSV